MSAVVEAERLVERMSQPDSVVQGDHFKQHQRATQAEPQTPKMKR